MTQVLPRTNFSSSKLTRLLADLNLVDAAGPGPAFAEKLGLWLNVADAMTIYAAHHAGAAKQPAASAAAAAAAHAAAAAEYARVRAALANSITHGDSPGAGARRIALPQPAPAAPTEIAAAYEPYRRYYLAQQRHMDAAIGPLRAELRDALTRAVPALGKLAALDAAFDGILSGREAKLAATVPALLEKRFEQLRAAHLQTLAATRQTDDTAAWTQPGGWLARFCRELQQALLAELDLRLQPVAGLMEAFSNEVSRQQ